MGSHDEKKHLEEVLEKSINADIERRERQSNDQNTYTREDKQVTRDELPPVYPKDEDD